jgi:hypothetical protein
VTFGFLPGPRSESSNVTFRCRLAKNAGDGTDADIAESAADMARTRQKRLQVEPFSLPLAFCFY